MVSSSPTFPSNPHHQNELTIVVKGQRGVQAELDPVVIAAEAIGRDSPFILSGGILTYLVTHSKPKSASSGATVAMGQLSVMLGASSPPELLALACVLAEAPLRAQYLPHRLGMVQCYLGSCPPPSRQVMLVRPPVKVFSLVGQSALQAAHAGAADQIGLAVKGSGYVADVLQAFPYFHREGDSVTYVGVVVIVKPHNAQAALPHGYTIGRSFSVTYPLQVGSCAGQVVTSPVSACIRTGTVCGLQSGFRTTWSMVLDQFPAHLDAYAELERLSSENRKLWTCSSAPVDLVDPAAIEFVRARLAEGERQRLARVQLREAASKPAAPPGYPVPGVFPGGKPPRPPPSGPSSRGSSLSPGRAAAAVGPPLTVPEVPRLRVPTAPPLHLSSPYAVLPVESLPEYTELVETAAAPLLPLLSGPAPPQARHGSQLGMTGVLETPSAFFLPGDLPTAHEASQRRSSQGGEGAAVFTGGSGPPSRGQSPVRGRSSIKTTRPLTKEEKFEAARCSSRARKLVAAAERAAAAADRLVEVQLQVHQESVRLNLGALVPADPPPPSLPNSPRDPDPAPDPAGAQGC